MPILTANQLQTDASLDGFTGTGLQDIVAIALAESGGNTDATNTVGNSAGVDRGVLQINSYYHPEVSNAQAFDPIAAFKAAFGISKSGTDFTPWSAFDNGSYQQYLNSTTQGEGQLFPSCTKDPTQWYCQVEGETYGQSYNGSVEHGNDLNETFHTPISMLYGGTVTDASYHPWGGQVGVLTNIPGYGSVVEYIQHLDDISSNVTVGSTISAGQVVGLSGGQLGYGDHPNDPTYSTGPHVEFGFNAPWVAGLSQAVNKSGFNSQFAINSAKSGKLQQGAGANTPATTNASSGNPLCDNFLWIFGVDCSKYPTTSTVFNGVDLKDGAIRTGLILVGIILVVLGIVRFFG